MITQQQLILGVLVPFLLALVVLSIPAVFPGRRGRWAGGLAVGVAFAAANLALQKRHIPFPPVAAMDRLLFLAIPLAGVGALLALRLPEVLRATLACLAILLATWYVLAFKQRQWAPGMLWGFIAVTTLGLGIAWGAIDRSMRAERGFTPVLGTIMILGLACLLMALSGSQTFAQFAGAAVVAVLAAAVVTLMGLPRQVAFGSIPLVAVAIVGLVSVLALEPMLAEVRPVNLILLGCAPPLLWAGQFIRLPTRPRWVEGAVQLALPAIPALVAVAIAGVKFARDMAQSTGSGYEY